MAIYTTYAQFRTGFAVSATIGLDGFPLWPGNLVEDIGTIVPPSTITVFPFEIDFDDSMDPTPGVDRYDWYVSQRTDDPTRQYLTVSRNDDLPDTQSGRISVGLTALGSSRFSVPLSVSDILELFTDVDVYVKTKADNAIHHVLLLDYLTGD